MQVNSKYNSWPGILKHNWSNRTVAYSDWSGKLLLWLVSNVLTASSLDQRLKSEKWWQQQNFEICPRVPAVLSSSVTGGFTRLTFDSCNTSWHHIVSKYLQHAIFNGFQIIRFIVLEQAVALFAKVNGMLQVLDLGFNLLRSLPSNAFRGITSLTLLALDGNPLATLPEEVFAHLNISLRGLSLGGRFKQLHYYFWKFVPNSDFNRFLACDCRLRWVAKWIREHDLQVWSSIWSVLQWITVSHLILEKSWSGQ